MKIAGFCKNSPHILIRILKKFETVELWSGSDTLSQPDFHILWGRLSKNIACSKTESGSYNLFY